MLPKIVCTLVFTIAIVFFTAMSASGQDTYSRQDELVLPEFVTDAPRYCLLTFPAGENERQTVLIVTDGDRLYVDRDSDGDLTNDGPFLTSKRREWESDRFHSFTIDELQTGELVHKSILVNLSPLERYDRGDLKIKEILKAEPGANAYSLSAEIQDDRFQGTWTDGRVVVTVAFSDIDGVLQFGKSIESAPTINLCGNLEIRLDSEMKLRPGRDADVLTSVGTAGSGPGTFASLGYEKVIPEFMHPRVSLKVTLAESGKIETKTYELSHRC